MHTEYITYVDNKVYIYALVDPRIDPGNKDVFYVGQTVMPDMRLRMHILDAKRGKKDCHSLVYIRKLIAKGFYPKMLLLCYLDTATEKKMNLEKKTIIHFKHSGHPIVNHIDASYYPEGKFLRDISTIPFTPIPVKLARQGYSEPILDPRTVTPFRNA